MRATRILRSGVGHAFTFLCIGIVLMQMRGLRVRVTPMAVNFGELVLIVLIAATVFVWYYTRKI